MNHLSGITDRPYLAIKLPGSKQQVTVLAAFISRCLSVELTASANAPVHSKIIIITIEILFNLPLRISLSCYLKFLSKSGEIPVVIGDFATSSVFPLA